MVKHIFDPDTFGSDFGLTTLSKDEKMFDLSVTNNPSNWLGPIWLVANYVVFRGLLNYGYRMEAEIMYKRTMRLLGEDLEKTGCLHEYYNPFNGEPVMNGFFPSSSSARAAGKTGRKAIVIIRFFCCEVSEYRKRIAEYVEFCSPFFV